MRRLTKTLQTKLPTTQCLRTTPTRYLHANTKKQFNLTPLLIANKRFYSQVQQSDVPVTFDITNEKQMQDYVVDSKVPVIVSVLVESPQLDEMDATLRNAVSKEDGNLRYGRIKANENPEIAQHLGVEKVPTILVILEKQVINKAVGILTERSANLFVRQILRFVNEAESQSIMSSAEASLEKNDITEAATQYKELLSKKYKYESFALSGLALCALKEGNLELAKEFIDEVKSSYEEDLSNPKIKQAVSTVELSVSGQSSKFNEQELKEKLSSNPKDMQALYDLAQYYQSVSRFEDSLDLVYRMIKIDKEWNNQAAKHFMFKMFDILGDTELTTKARKRFNNLWFS